MTPVKYITCSILGVEQAVVFSGALQHAHVWAALDMHYGERAKFGKDMPSLIGAAFAGADGKPHGSSDSLGIGPGPDDEFLLAQLLRP